MPGASSPLRASWAGAILAAGLLLFCGCGASRKGGGEPHAWPRGQSAMSYQKPRSSVRHVAVGLMPCAIYSIDINGRRASFARATPEGRVAFTAALNRFDAVRITLYRRMPCAS